MGGFLGSYVAYLLCALMFVVACFLHFRRVEGVKLYFMGVSLLHDVLKVRIAKRAFQRF